METQTRAATEGPARTRRPASAEARIRTWVLGTLAIIGPPLLLAVYYKQLFSGLVNPEAMDFAQLGRNLSAGHGFSTYFLRPLALDHGGDVLRQPELIHGPLFPLLLAIAFAIGGARDSIAAAVSGLFYLATIPVVYRLGRRMFGHRVGLLTTLIFTVNALTLEYATSGMHITLAVFLTTWLLLALYDGAAKAGANEAFPKDRIVLAGILTGLLYLTDPLLLWLAPVVGIAVASFHPNRRTQALLWFAIPLLIVCGPWMVRTARLTGNPFFGLRGMELWMNTKNSYPGLSAYRMFPADLLPKPGLLQDVLRKIYVQIGPILDGWPQISANWVLAFFLPSVLFRFSDRNATHLRRVILWMFLALMVGMLLFQVQMPLFVCIVPAVLAYAVAYLLFLVQQAQLTRQGTVVLCCVLGAALLYPVTSALTVQSPPAQPPAKETAQNLPRVSAPGDVVLTDQPWTVSWYADRPAVLLPEKVERIGDVRRMFPSTRWLLVTQSVSAASPEWQAVYGLLLRWSVAWSAAKASDGRVKPPDAFVIQGNQAPILTALSGFAPYPPLEPINALKPGAAPVLAFVPPAQAIAPVAPPAPKR